MDFLFAENVEVQEHLVRVFGLGRGAAALVILALTTFGALLGSSLWSLLVWARDRARYGGWVVRVRGGRSGRAWHMPLDTATAKALCTENFVAFKRDLGSIFSGEGTADFSLGVPQNEPCCHAPPQAPGLTIDLAKRTIDMDFAARPPAAPREVVPVGASECKV